VLKSGSEIHLLQIIALFLPWTLTTKDRRALKLSVPTKRIHGHGIIVVNSVLLLEVAFTFGLVQPCNHSLELRPRGPEYDILG